jgi:hypothetical protein
MRQAQPWKACLASLSLVIASGFLQLYPVARAGEWSLPDDRLGIRTAPLLLLSRPDVQADLKLDRTQVLAAQNMINELTRRAVALRGKTGSGVIAERRAIDQTQLDWLGKNLTGNQLERLRQIELQWEGPGAMLSRPMVSDYLRLTSEQRQKLARIVSQRAATRAKVSFPPTDHQSLTLQVRSLLSPSQYALWTNLLGTPLRFAATTPVPGSRDPAVQQAEHTQPAR